MPIIIIQELERDDAPITDLWATIEMQSEKTGLTIQFQLENICLDWDMQKLESVEYLNAFDRWVTIANANKFMFKVENINFVPIK